MSKLLTALVIGVLMLSLAASSVGAYWGYGIAPVGQYHLRADSTGGPGVLGGGPGTGK